MIKLNPCPLCEIGKMCFQSVAIMDLDRGQILNKKAFVCTMCPYVDLVCTSMEVSQK